MNPGLFEGLMPEKFDSPVGCQGHEPLEKARVKEGRDGVSTPPLFPVGKYPGLKAEVSLTSMNCDRSFYCLLTGKQHHWPNIPRSLQCILSRSVVLECWSVTLLDRRIRRLFVGREINFER